MISHLTVNEGGMEIADRDHLSKSQEQCQEVDKEVAKMRKRDVSMPDEAEGQRLNLSSVMKMTDMSKLSLGRMKSVQSTLESSKDRRDACCS